MAKVVRGSSDILIARNGKPLAISETKAPSHNLSDEDGQQAISYARLLGTIAPFAKVYEMLTDGRSQIDNPQNSIWNTSVLKKSASAFADEILHKAAQTLIAINPNTVDEFRQLQVANALSDFKSDIQKNIPELYVERQHSNNAFTKC